MMDIVNVILKASEDKQCINKAECETLMSVRSTRCRPFFQRKVNYRAFEKERTHLTATTSKGHNAFLAPLSFVA